MEIVWSKVVAMQELPPVGGPSKYVEIIFDGGVKVVTGVPYADLVEQMRGALRKESPERDALVDERDHLKRALEEQLVSAKNAHDSEDQVLKLKAELEAVKKDRDWINKGNLYLGGIVEPLRNERDALAAENTKLKEALKADLLGRSQILLERDEWKAGHLRLTEEVKSMANEREHWEAMIQARDQTIVETASVALPQRAPVPQYLACPHGRGVDDPDHQPEHQYTLAYGLETAARVRLPVKCSCGFVVTDENAKRMDAY
jgi:hypothetical protein